jgi:hypothetical protein
MHTYIPYTSGPISALNSAHAHRKGGPRDPRDMHIDAANDSLSDERAGSHSQGAANRQIGAKNTEVGAPHRQSVHYLQEDAAERPKVEVQVVRVPPREDMQGVGHESASSPDNNLARAPHVAPHQFRPLGVPLGCKPGAETNVAPLAVNATEPALGRRYLKDDRPHAGAGELGNEGTLRLPSMQAESHDAMQTPVGDHDHSAGCISRALSRCVRVALQVEKYQHVCGNMEAMC